MKNRCSLSAAGDGDADGEVIVDAMGGAFRRQHCRPGRQSPSMLVGAILGVELLGDRLGPGIWIGGALIIAAAVVLTTGRGEQEAAVG
ncbi:MAG TPA: hypothetical protein VIY53_03325 [Acidobacteriaceae bacterium]